MNTSGESLPPPEAPITPVFLDEKSLVLRAARAWAIIEKSMPPDPSPAPGSIALPDWNTVKKLETLTDASSATLKKVFTLGNLTPIPLLPSRRASRTAPHYSPRASAFTVLILAAEEAPEGWPSLVQIAAEADVTPAGARSRLRKMKAQSVLVRAGLTATELHFEPNAARKAIAAIPPKEMPRDRISMTALMHIVKMTHRGARLKLLRAGYPPERYRSRTGHKLAYNSAVLQKVFGLSKAHAATPAGERPFVRYGRAGAMTTVQQVEYGEYASQERHWHAFVPIGDLLPYTTMSESEAIQFVLDNGGRIDAFPNENGSHEAYLLGVSAGLLRHCDRKKYKPQKLTPDFERWLCREELAALLDKPIGSVDKELAAILNTRLHRSELDGVLIPGAAVGSGNEVTQRARTPFIWALPRDGRDVVIPHYNTAVIRRIFATFGEVYEEKALDWRWRR